MNLPAASAIPSPRSDSVAPDDAGQVAVLRLPSAARALRYGARWWALAVPGLLRQHRLRPGRAGHYAARFEPDTALRDAFSTLFDLRNGPVGVNYPFMYAQGVNELLQARVLADLGVNLRHVHLLRHRTRLPAGGAQGLAVGGQQLDCQLMRAVRVGPTEVLLLLETRIRDDAGHHLALVEDALLVSALQVADAVQASEDDLLRRAASRLRRRGAELDGGANDVQVRQLYIATDAGRRFGRLSGQISPVHTSRLGARLLGRRHPHVQPMYLRNLVTRELAEWGVGQSELQLSFIRKSCLGQTLRLLRKDSAFELLDERGRLVAFGSAT